MDFVTGEILIIDKPYRWTSFDAVKRIRGAIQRRLKVKKFKVGHAGTLDPLATGILIVCTGRATKEIDRLQAGEKEYIATLRLGATTPSYDLETEIDAEYPTDHITAENAGKILERFRGRIMQVPPIFSAVKIDGKRAYKYARKGTDIELKAKPLEITELELLQFKPGKTSYLEENSEFPCMTIRVVCSKGTYIRALARDIGEALGSGAHLTALRRTRVGNFTEKDAVSIDRALEIIDTTEIPVTQDTKDKTIDSPYQQNNSK